MYLMRPLSQADRPLVDTLLVARTRWAQQHNRPHHGHNLALLNLIEDIHEDTEVIGMLEDSDLIGVLALDRDAPLVGWTAAEREEPALTVSSAITHPARHGERLARLASLWLSDYAARLPGPLDWVRTAVPDSELATYLQVVCGWHLVRGSRDPDGHLAYRLQLRVQTTPALHHLVAGSAELATQHQPSTPSGDPAACPARDDRARPDLLHR